MIEIIFYFGLFAAGLFVGSFLNVVADRSVKGGKILFGRSQCDHCKKTLNPIDLIPLLSFAKTKGRCRHCNKKISYWYPVSEVLTGLSFAGLAYFLNVFGNTQSALIWILYVYFLVVVGFYIVIFLADLKYRIIPNRIVYPAIIWVAVFLLFNLGFTAIVSYNALKGDEFGQYLLEAGYWHSQMFVLLKGALYTLVSAFVIALVFWVLTRIKGGKAMGGGDVKLAFLIGLFNGFPFNILAIFLGFLLGAVFSIGLILLGRKTIKDTVPFGPFLILGSLVTLVWGPVILEWYLGLF